jgi:1,2-diacylglycerol 3-beta-glucosyltransferase
VSQVPLLWCLARSLKGQRGHPYHASWHDKRDAGLAAPGLDPYKNARCKTDERGAALRKALWLCIAAIQLPMAMFVLYLDLLMIASAFWRRHVKVGNPARRFAIIIPAHDEEILLPALLASCGNLAYPRELFDVHVIADNCTDRTAEAARQYDVVVHERVNEHQRGKGYALAWLIDKLASQDIKYDAYVIVDADTEIAANLLTVFDAHLARGDQAIQCYYGVQNRNQGWTAMLRHVALVLYNGVRPRGRDALGLSAGLRGNGMCFAAPVVERFGWDATTLTEDAEFHLHLLEGGIRVRYAPQTSVTAEMPISLRQARTQNVRWERGRLQLARTQGLSLLFDGLRRRDPRRLDALAELVMPPLSMMGAISVMGLVVSTVFRARTALKVARFVTVGLVCYVFGGLLVAREQPRTYLALLMAPPYAAWKMGIYVISALHIDDRRWLRTERSAPQDVKRP